MTKPRDPASVKYAVLRCLGTLGREVETITGKSERYIRMCSDPDEEGRHITVRDAIRLDRAMREAGHGTPIFAAYAERIDAVPNGRAGHCPMLAFLQFAEDVGGVARAVADAHADGVVTPAERRAVAGAAHAAIDDLKALIETVEPPAAVPIARAAR